MVKWRFVFVRAVVWAIVLGVTAGGCSSKSASVGSSSGSSSPSPDGAGSSDDTGSTVEQDASFPSGSFGDSGMPTVGATTQVTTSLPSLPPMTNVVAALND